MTQPLSGIVVVDFTTLLPGPLATLMLAEAGAEVVKIERSGGEELRRHPPYIERRERRPCAAQSRQEKHRARSQSVRRPRPARAASRPLRRGGRAIPSGRDGAAWARLRNRQS